MKLRQEAKQAPLTREMQIYPEGPQPGPEVYSLQAHNIVLEMAKKGP